MIGDLGFARTIETFRCADSYCGTPLYIAPEIMNGKKYGPKVDIWSFGVMMFEILMGFTPFSGRSIEDLENRINKGHYAVPKEINISLN